MKFYAACIPNNPQRMERGPAMKSSKSIVLARQQAILKLLKKERRIDVDTVSERLNVSPTTVRRDLATFEKQNLVKRFHGGAELVEGTLKEEDVFLGDETIQKDLPQKEAIARYAANLIQDGDTIFINSSSTTLLLLRYLGDKHVIVVTNNGNAVNMPTGENVSVLLTGGQLYERRKSLVGEFALHTLMKINADKAFLGVGGISVRAGITTSVLQETAINEMMMRRCQGACYVLAANTKIGRAHNFLSGTIDQVSTLITCTGADEKELDNIQSQGVEVIECTPESK